MSIASLLQPNTAVKLNERAKINASVRVNRAVITARFPYTVQANINLISMQLEAREDL